MLPGVELARRRRVHYHGGDVVSAAGVHHHHAHGHHHRGGGESEGGVTGPALAARIRLEEKLRGAGPPSSPSSRWSRLLRERDGRRSSMRLNRQEQQHEEEGIMSTSTDLRSPAPGSAVLAAAAATSRAELRRTLSKVDLCAVCLDEVREERHQRVTRLPCSHEYHSECVLPWLAVHPDCPCCRTLVPRVHTLS